jgi:hypothetical protein
MSLSVLRVDRSVATQVEDLTSPWAQSVWRIRNVRGPQGLFEDLISFCPSRANKFRVSSSSGTNPLDTAGGTERLTGCQVESHRTVSCYQTYHLLGLAYDFVQSYRSICHGPSLQRHLSIFLLPRRGTRRLARVNDPCWSELPYKRMRSFRTFSSHRIQSTTFLQINSCSLVNIVQYAARLHRGTTPKPTPTRAARQRWEESTFLLPPCRNQQLFLLRPVLYLHCLPAYEETGVQHAIVWSRLGTDRTYRRRFQLQAFRRMYTDSQRGGSQAGSAMVRRF